MERLYKIISGGQTGVDQAALRAAQKVGLATGGWTLPNFVTLDGPTPSLGSQFQLRELPADQGMNMAQNYIKRSKLNVDESDASLIFRFKQSLGTDKTLGYCLSGRWGSPDKRHLPPKSGDQKARHRPCFVITSLNANTKSKIIEAFSQFIRQYNVVVLNVAGHREKEYESAVEKYLKECLVSVGEKNDDLLSEIK